MSLLPCVTFILPAYRKAAVLQQVIERLIRCCECEPGFITKIVVVLDGPDRESLHALERIETSILTVIELPKNVGKGNAIRAGARVAVCDVVVVLDADLDIHPESAIGGVKLMLGDEQGRMRCAYGSKFHPLSEVSYPLKRTILSHGFNFLVKLLCGLRVEDSQVGLKVVHGETFRRIASKCTENKFLFDVELLHHIAREGGELRSLPVRLTHGYDSTIGWRAICGMFADVVRLSMKLRMNRRSVLEK